MDTPTANIKIDAKEQTVYISVPASSFVPKYLWYQFKYLKIPHNYKIVFTDGTYKFNDEGSELIDIS